MNLHGVKINTHQDRKKTTMGPLTRKIFSESIRPKGSQIEKCGASRRRRIQKNVAGHPNGGASTRQRTESESIVQRAAHLKKSGGSSRRRPVQNETHFLSSGRPGKQRAIASNVGFCFWHTWVTSQGRKERFFLRVFFCALKSLIKSILNPKRQDNYHLYFT